MNTLNTLTDIAALTALTTDNGKAKFLPYSTELNIPEVSGTRIVKCLYRAKAGAKKAAADSYVRIPDHITEEVVAERITELAPYVVSFLQGVEDGILREEHKAGSEIVYTPALSIDKLITHLEEKGLGRRLTKESIAQWFTAVLKDTLAVKFAEKMNITDSSGAAEFEKLETVLNAYEAKFILLAGSASKISAPDKEAMIKVIDACNVRENTFSRRVLAILEVSKEKEEDLLALL